MHLSIQGTLFTGFSTLAGLGFYISGPSVLLKVLAGIATYMALSTVVMTIFMIAKRAPKKDAAEDATNFISVND